MKAKQIKEIPKDNLSKILSDIDAQLEKAKGEEAVRLLNLKLTILHNVPAIAPAIIAKSKGKQPTKGKVNTVSVEAEIFWFAVALFFGYQFLKYFF